MKIVAGVATDTGQVRDHNEDSFIVEPPLYAIADGMGGANAGEVASQLALETIGDMQRAGETTLDDEVREANRVVFTRSGEDTKFAGMGTTVTAALASAEALHLVHVGDSRAYLLRAGSLRQLTHDHTLVDRMVQAGEISRDEADVHPHRNVLIRALGTEPKVDVEALDLGLLDGDQVLICSDGLTDMVSDEDILDVVERHRGDLDRVTKSLVAAANRGGGEDNITVVAFEISEDGGETARMPMVEEDTMENVAAPKVDTMVVPPEHVEEVFVEPGSPEAAAVTRREPISPAARVRLVLAMLLLLSVAAVLLVWGLVR